MPQYFNRRYQISIRRGLRRESTLAERILWRHLRDRQLEGLKIRRQFGILGYVVDFYCVELRLAIEIDGITHASADAKERDSRRQREIESLGVKFLRIKDDDVVDDVDEVLRRLRQFVARMRDSSTSPRPLPTVEGEPKQSS